MGAETYKADQNSSAGLCSKTSIENTSKRKEERAGKKRKQSKDIKHAD